MHLRCGRREDLPYAADIASSAFWDDELVAFLAPYRHDFPLSHRASYLYRIKRLFYAGELLIVAVTDSKDSYWNGKEAILGFAVWSDTRDNAIAGTRPDSVLVNGMACKRNKALSLMRTALEQKLLRLEGLYRRYFNVDKSSDKACLERFWHVLSHNAFFEDIYDYCELEILAVSPAFQRRGIGSALLTDGMQRAAKHELPVTVAATTRGKNFYLGHGFQETSKLSFGLQDLSWTALTWNPSIALSP